MNIISPSIITYQGDGATRKLDAADEGMQPLYIVIFSQLVKANCLIPSETLASLYLLNVRIVLPVFIPLLLSTVEPFIMDTIGSQTFVPHSEVSFRRFRYVSSRCGIHNRAI